MVIALHGRHLRPLAPPRSSAPFLVRVSRRAVDEVSGEWDALLVDDERPLPDGYRAYLVRGQGGDPSDRKDVYRIERGFEYLDEGDIVRIDPDRRTMGVLYRRASRFNSMLVTERCDNYCVMCSQPPKDRMDDWLVDDLLDMIPLMCPDTPEIGITGGEPALLGERLLEVVDCLARTLPRTALHVLSNGRAFRDPTFAAALAEVRHPDLMVGIPLYGSLPDQHDFIVQRRGAFEDTIRGILNLKRHGVRVELRFVIHAETYCVLPEFARFVTRNLLFADHVALMGLELMGFARSNVGALWIDPLDYQVELGEAARILTRARVPTSIYNHQLCVLDPALHHLARRSISDWKNQYFEDCERCQARDACGGFFASSGAHRSRGITPYLDSSTS